MLSVLIAFQILRGLAELDETKEELKRFLASSIAELYLFVAVRRSLSWLGERVQSHSLSMCRRPDLRVDRAGSAAC